MMKWFVIAIALLGAGCNGHSAPPPPPPPITVTLSWEPGGIDAQHGAAVEYLVYRSVTPGGPYQLLATVPAETLTWVDPAPVAGADYYVFAATNAAGTSGYSVEVGVRP